jgi:hypothetical protein
MRGTQERSASQSVYHYSHFLMKVTTVSVKTLDSVDHFLVVVLFLPVGSTTAMADVGQCLKQ